MAAPAAQVSTSASKNAKKRAKLVDRTASPAPSTLTAPPPERAASVDGGLDDEGQSPYVREIQKNIRSINKKISNTTKTEAVVADHPGKSLDELVAERIINADQKASIQKKPGLQAQVTSLQEQLTQYNKIDQEYRARAKTDQEELEKSLAEKYEVEKNAAIKELRQALEVEHKQSTDGAFLAISQFLRLAAARRTEEADQSIDENMALEGVLLAIYTGDETAVETMGKLVEASEDHTVSTSNEKLQTTFAQVKAASEAYKMALFGEAQVQVDPSTVETDPTIAHAGMTEIAAGDLDNVINGHPPEEAANGVPANAETDNVAANEAANEASRISQDWQLIQQPTSLEKADPVAEPTAEPAKGAPAELPASSSWAEEHPEQHPEPAAPTPQADSDGFHQVHRNRPRGNAEHGWRNRVRGDGRGRGHRGDHRGRGRSGFRGGRDGHGSRDFQQRGPRREES